MIILCINYVVHDDNTNAIDGSILFHKGEVPHLDCFHLSAVNICQLTFPNAIAVKKEFHLGGGRCSWSGKQRDTLEEILNCNVAAVMK